MSHTPGPWAWDSRNGKHYLVSCAGDTPHAIVLGWPCGMEDGTWFTSDAYGDADMRLIAAAPELVDALKLAYDNLGQPAPDLRVFDIVKSAIAKAEGAA